jgi:hypothetical protein
MTSTSAKVKAATAAGIQQGLVSGLTWGGVNKIGLAVAGVAFPGSTAAVSVANVLGGVALGPAHLLMENLVVRVRHRIGHGAEFNPDSNDARSKYFREGVFVGCFYAASGIKSVVKVTTGAGPWVGFGIDVVSSLLAGAGAQLLTTFRKPIVETGANVVYPAIGAVRPDVRSLALKKVTLPRVSVREMAVRTVAGLAVGGMTTVAELGSVKDDTVGDLVRVAAHNATKSFVALSTWFGIRSMLSNVLDKMPEHRVSGHPASAGAIQESNKTCASTSAVEGRDLEKDDVFFDASDVSLDTLPHLSARAELQCTTVEAMKAVSDEVEDDFHDALDSLPY